MPRTPNYNREELINRARDLFWKQGWAGTSLKDLEAELQLKPGSFYAAFGSKDALFELALKKYSSDGISRLEKLAKTEGPLRALQMFPTIVIENSEAPARACMLSKTFLELQAKDHPLAKKANKHLNKMENQFAKLFHKAQLAGEIETGEDPKLLAAKYQSELLGLRVTAQRELGKAKKIANRMSASLGEL